jgi:predicted RNA binding protein YcfA (HicA-like mRNA interferase family)
MARLPVLSGKELIKILEKYGFEQKRQRGSHVILRKNDKVTVVPLHKNIDRGTLIEIIRQCGLKREEFISICKK